jgi:hypothetical protein
MAKIDFKSLSPEEVAALSPKDKANYDKWFAKQSSGSQDPDSEDEEDEKEPIKEPEIEDQKEPEPDGLVEVEVTSLFQVNTTVHGHLYPGKKYQIGKAIAEQLEQQGHVKIIG